MTTPRYGFWCRQTLIDRGWTPALIRHLLGDPARIDTNPANSRWAPMTSWHVDDVLREESGPLWRHRREGRWFRSRQARIAQGALRLKEAMDPG